MCRVPAVANLYHDSTSFLLRLTRNELNKPSIITGPPTHSVGARLVMVAGAVVVCNAAHLQRNSPGGSTRRRASSVTSR